jgi:hypothetical protein
MSHRDEDHPQDDGHCQNGPFEVKRCQQERAQQKTQALHSVLRSGEDGHPAEQAPVFRRREQLHRRFRGHFGEVLGDPREALDAHDEGYRDRYAPARIKLPQSEQRGHLQSKSGIKCRG